jgi:SOS-response transcriptional repressor LexA
MTADAPPRRTIPIAAAEADAGERCSGGEPYALMVLGDSMAPEFVEGEIIVVEPEGLARDGAFVVAEVAGEPIFRALAKRGDGWQLCPLNPAYPAIDLPNLDAVRGIVIQKSRPGRRRASKRYV